MVKQRYPTRTAKSSGWPQYPGYRSVPPPIALGGCEARAMLVPAYRHASRTDLRTEPTPSIPAIPPPVAFLGEAMASLFPGIPTSLTDRFAGKVDTQQAVLLSESESEPTFSVTVSKEPLVVGRRPSFPAGEMLTRAASRNTIHHTPEARLCVLRGWLLYASSFSECNMKN